jgi:hypothetical protein
MGRFNVKELPAKSSHCALKGQTLCAVKEYALIRNTYSYIALCMISRTSSVQICALLVYNAASSGNHLPTFRDNVSIPSSRVKSKKLCSLPQKLYDLFSEDSERLTTYWEKYGVHKINFVFFRSGKIYSFQSTEHYYINKNVCLINTLHVSVLGTTRTGCAA